MIKKNLPRNSHNACTSVAPSSKAADVCPRWNRLGDLDLTPFCAFLEYKSTLKLGLHFVSPCSGRGRGAGMACGSEVLRKWFFYFPEHIEPSKCSSAFRLPRGAAASSELLHSFLGALRSSHKYIFPPEILDWAIAGVDVGGWHTEGWAGAARGLLQRATSIFALQWIASCVSFSTPRALLSGASHLFQSTKKNMQICWLRVWNVAAPPG